MANFNLYSWLDTKANPFGTNSAIVAFKASQIVIESADSKMVLGGSGFVLDANGQYGGTITSLRLYEMDISGATAAERLVMENTTDLSLGLQGLMSVMSSYYSSTNSFDYLLSGDDSLTGTAGNDSINGRRGNDTIAGGDGDDYLYGGYAYYDPTSPSVEGQDSLIGGKGNDTLDGGDGHDTMVGGAGNDLYMVSQADDVVIEEANGGYDRVQVTASSYSSTASNFNSYTLTANVESLDIYHYGYTSPGMDPVFTARGNDLANKITVGSDGMMGNGSEYLYGLGGNDRLYSGGGNDTLDGGSGNDTMLGGAGSDTYIVDALDDVVSESVLGAGTTDSDTVVVQIAGTQTWSLGGTAGGLSNKKVFSSIENLSLGDAASTSAQNGVGNDMNNTLTGNAGANKLYGLAGDDSLTGGAGKDLLDGGSGNDTLASGVGADTLAGGTGNDRFVFNTAAEAGLGAARDVVKDFAAGDLVDLRAIDADGFTFNDQAFTFIGSAAFSSANATGQLRYAAGVLYGSTDADAQAEFEIAFANKPSLTVSDFLL